MVHPGQIGFDQCCRRMIALSFALKKLLNLQVDQKNHDREDHTERAIRIVEHHGYVHTSDKPLIWLIHVISPSAYEAVRFLAIAQAPARLDIGVFYSPSAATSMRQLRPLQSPTHNAIARVLELLVAGVHVQLGTDNVCDITAPACTLDIADEVFVLSNAVRYRGPEVMACLASGRRVPDTAVRRVNQHLEEDRDQCASTV